jgi:hypothetical protein
MTPAASDESVTAIAGIACGMMSGPMVSAAAARND